ncbi:MAG TPA: hypothetical protein VFR81_26700 [Longimicrobium sp.]|nr:hypothetical protein [Longimicrobium sp.]
MLATRRLGTEGLTVSALGLGLMAGEDRAMLDAALAPEKISGPRHGEKQMATVDR